MTTSRTSCRPAAGSSASLLGLLLFTLACGDDSSIMDGELDSGQGDASVDSGPPPRMDAGTRSDAGMDGATEAGMDAATEAGADAATEAGADASAEGGSDAATDAGMDAGVDSGSDAGGDSGADSGADPDTDAGACGSPDECDDGNFCTVDGCDPDTGCTATAVSCNDGDPCTIDGCNPDTGCTAIPACDDLDSCTRDSCDSVTGCEFVPECERGACTNFVDDDADGTTDCDDPTCAGEPACNEFGPYCRDGMDNDGDGAGVFDCGFAGWDPDCTFERTCMESCGNGIDDDEDGATDECSDLGCSRVASCGIETDALCANDTDDDNDGATDCDDADCSVASACGDGCPALVLSSAPMTGTNAAAPAMRTGPCAATTTGRELSFLVTATTPGIHTFDTYGSTYDTVLYVRDACNGVDLTCNDDHRGSAQSATAVVLAAGESVVVFLDAADASAVGTYVLNVTRP